MKHSCSIWLKNQNNLTRVEQAPFKRLKDVHLKTPRAYHLRVNFQEMYWQPPRLAEAYLEKWYSWATIVDSNR